jgi:hypothetical protein
MRHQLHAFSVGMPAPALPDHLIAVEAEGFIETWSGLSDGAHNRADYPFN